MRADSILEEDLLLLSTIRDLKVPAGSIQLSALLNIPPATIGRRLNSLEERGYLEKVSNKGRLITEKGIEYLLKKGEMNNKYSKAHELIQNINESSLEKLEEILEIRRKLETYSVELACKNGTKEQINELNDILRDHIHEIKLGGLGNNEDLKIHLKIAEMSKNSTLYQVLNLLLTSDNAYTKFSTITKTVMQDQIEQHQEVIRMISERKVEQAIIAMDKHLQQVIKDIEKYKEENHCGEGKDE